MLRGNVQKNNDSIVRIREIVLDSIYIGIYSNKPVQEIERHNIIEFGIISLYVPCTKQCHVLTILDGYIHVMCSQS